MVKRGEEKGIGEVRGKEKRKETLKNEKARGREAAEYLDNEEKHIRARREA